MVRSRTQSVFTRRFADELGGREPDELVVEEPLTIRLDDHQVSSTMRTPGHDFELAAGFLHAEGVLEPEWVTGIRYCGTGSPVDSEFNVVSVETGGRAPEPAARLGSISSSCGVCGTEAIETLTERLRVLPAYEPWPDGKQFARYKHPISGHIYERIEDNVVHVIDKNGGVSVFDARAVSSAARRLLITRRT